MLATTVQRPPRCSILLDSDLLFLAVMLSEQENLTWKKKTMNFGLKFWLSEIIF